VLAANGTGAQYIDGAGALQTFPSIPQGIVTSLTTNNTSGAATLNAGTGVLNIPIYSAGGSYDWSLFADTGDIDPIASGDQVTIAGGTNVTTAIVGNTLTIDATQAVASLTTNNTSGAATLSGGILNVPIYATPAAGAAGDVQFNDGSNGFAAEGEFNYNTATNTLKVQGVTNQPSLKLASAQQQTPGLNSLLSEIESYYLTSEVGKIKFLGDGAFGIGTSNPTRLELQTTSAGAVVATTKATIKATGELILNQYGSGTFNSTAVKSLGVTASGNVVERDVSGGNINEMATQSLDVNSASAIGMQSSNVKLVLTNSDGTGATKTVQISGSTATLGTTTNGIMTIKVQSSQVAGGLGQTQITYASPSGSVNIGPAASSAAWILTFAYYGEADMVLIDATAI
jgi:hypothetical protein